MLHVLRPMSASSDVASGIDPVHSLSERLARGLLDLRKTLEAHLRALTSTQCLLERIRAGDADGEITLLVAEISRLMTEASSSMPAAAGEWNAVLDVIERMRRHCVAAVHSCDPEGDSYSPSHSLSASSIAAISSPSH